MRSCDSIFCDRRGRICRRKSANTERSSSVCAGLAGVKPMAQRQEPVILAKSVRNRSRITTALSKISRNFATVVGRRQLASICYASLSNLGIIALNQLAKSARIRVHFLVAEGIVGTEPYIRPFASCRSTLPQRGKCQSTGKVFHEWRRRRSGSTL